MGSTGAIIQAKYFSRSFLYVITRMYAHNVALVLGLIEYKSVAHGDCLAFPFATVS